MTIDYGFDASISMTRVSTQFAKKKKARISIHNLYTYICKYIYDNMKPETCLIFFYSNTCVQFGFIFLSVSQCNLFCQMTQLDRVEHLLRST